MASASGVAPVLRVCYFYDTVSPYSFLAFDTFRRYLYSNTGAAAGTATNSGTNSAAAAAAAASPAPWASRVHLTLIPVFLGGVMRATGNQPPAMLPARGRHLGTDLRRAARLQDLRVSTPEDFPVSTLLAQRVLTALVLREAADGGTALSVRGAASSFVGPDVNGDGDGAGDGDVMVAGVAGLDNAVAQLSRELWETYWVQGKSIGDPEVVGGCITRALGCSKDEAEQLMTVEAQTPETKAALKAATDTAVAGGAFGAPTFFVTGGRADGRRRPQMWFGSDRFEQFAHEYELPWHGTGYGTRSSSKL